MITNITAVLTLGAFLFFARARLRRYLHFYQQDEYDTARFASWLLRSMAFDKRLSVVLLVVAAVGFTPVPPWIPIALSGVVLAVFGFFEPDPRKGAKKPLVMTKRASSIMWVALVLVAVAAAVLSWGLTPWGWIIAVQAVPLSLAAANFLLKPIETSTQRRFWNEAHDRLMTINPSVIGITGSFGKTSAKHILGHVLSLNARSFVTPGSVNTPMGISRVIRESLPTDVRFFVVEMGAYGPGSIERLCRLTPPNLGIITSIGEAHYERFKTLDTVARAKFELAEAVLGNPQGRVVIHSSVLQQQYARSVVDNHRDRFVICGADSAADVQIVQAEQTRRGLAVRLSREGQEYTIEAPVYGMQQVGNLAVVFATAVELGITPERVLASLRTTPQVQHRLEVKPQPDGSIYIDDAYNSNPIGFAAGLELMSRLTVEGGRRILVTPGLVELGEKHEEVHRELGQRAAEHTDVALVVRPERIPSFVEGFQGHDGNATLIPVETFSSASEWLSANVKKGDVVLIENDLPDLYERRLSV